MPCSPTAKSMERMAPSRSSLQEFLSVAAPRSGAKLWANDDVAPAKGAAVDTATAAGRR